GRAAGHAGARQDREPRRHARRSLRRGRHVRPRVRRRGAVRRPAQGVDLGIPGSLERHRRPPRRRSPLMHATVSLRLAGRVLALALAAVVPASAQTSSAPVTVIRNATVFTVSGDVIENGSILIRNGRIAAVGASVDVPRGATEIDATGKFVTPGIIDAHSHIAIDGPVNESSLSVTSMVGVEDVLDPHDINIYRGLAGGVTTSNILHGSANAIGGKNAVIKLRWGRDARGLLFEGAPPGIKFALGENPKRANRFGAGGDVRYPTTRMGVMDVI